MDLITQYGDYPIEDDAGFFAARNHHENAGTPTVEIVVWRGLSRMTAKVPAGWLGVSTTENNKVSEAFSSLMNRINSMREIPEYMHDREFKGQFKEGPTKILQKAKDLIDQAEREGTLTRAQVQVARIYLILDEAPEEDQKRQSELLKQFFETQPVNYIHMLGNDKFFKDKRYRAAVACFTHYLKTSPDDVSIRLNLAVAYNQVGMYGEAERAADYVFNHNLELSEHGHVVGYYAKAIAALGRKDYLNSIQFAEKAFAIDPDADRMMLVQLAAAQMGDRERFAGAIQKLQEAQPAKYIEKKLQIDAVGAYAMVKNNQRDAARKLVRMWKDLNRAEGKVIAYWRHFPDGMDVARNWADLMQN
jgi:tetratricopeptide (TPR) repeat protein